MSKHLSLPGSDRIVRPAAGWQEKRAQTVSTQRQLDQPERDDTLLDGGLRALSREEIRRQRSQEQSRSVGAADRIQSVSSKRGSEAEQLFGLLEKDNSDEFLLG